jgi:PTS system nitrogen regulatory IIA component
MSKVLTTKELSNYLKLHQVTIYKYAEDGTIPVIRIGKVWRFDKETIDNWVNEGRI